MIKPNSLYIDRKILPMIVKIFKFIFLIGVIFCLALEKSWAQDTLILTNLPKYPVREYIQVMEADPTKDIKYVVDSFFAKAFQPLPSQKAFNIGATSNIWWFALPIRNSLQMQNNVILIAATQNASLITLYEEVDGEFVPTDYTGYSIPLSERSLDTRLCAFELLLQPNEEKLYFVSVDTKGGNLYLPFYMDHPAHYWPYEVSRATHYGFFTGIFFLAFTIAMFLWVKTRESLYGYYFWYIFLSFFLILEEDGYAFYWIYGDIIPNLSMIIIPFTGTLGMVFLLQIMLKFHNYKTKSSFIFRFTKLSQSILIFLALANLWFLWFPHSYASRSLIYNLSFIGIIIAAFTALEGSLYKLTQGFEPAKLYLIAVSIMIIGLLNYSLNTLGVTNFNLFYPNGIAAGITFEIFIMVVALAYRYHLEREELSMTLGKERKAVATQILQTLENERERLAKDLHDELGGLLALIKMQLSHLSYKSSPIQSDLSETYSLVSKACNDLRAISHDLILEGQETRDLPSMVNEIIRYHEKNGHLKFHTYYKNVPQLDLDPKLTIFRMLKEVIQNVVKHAKATECTIQMIAENDKLRIMVEDNGIGIDNSKNGSADTEGIGLFSIRSRVEYLEGEMHLESNSSGTTFIFELPFGKEDKLLA